MRYLLQASRPGQVTIATPIMHATDFEILRGVHKNTQRPCRQQPRQKPLRLAILLSEDRFNQSTAAMVHNDTVLVDSEGHDWCWKEGTLYYYSHAMSYAETVTVVAIYAEKPTTAA